MSESKYLGTTHISNNSGLGVTQLDSSGETIQTVLITGDTVSRRATSKLNYTEDGRAYFKRCGMVFYLDEIMRCN